MRKSFRILASLRFIVSTADMRPGAKQSAPPAERNLAQHCAGGSPRRDFAGDNVNAVIANGTTPLMKASHGGQTKIVRALIAAGAQLEARNADGNNALWLACVGNHLEVMDTLIEAGIDIDNRNDNGATALMYAASTGKASIVERLLLAGADITQETLDGFTALDMAATIECLTLLRNASRALADRPKSRPGSDAKRVNL